MTAWFSQWVPSGPELNETFTECYTKINVKKLQIVTNMFVMINVCVCVHMYAYVHVWGFEDLKIYGWVYGLVDGWVDGWSHVKSLKIE